VTLGSNPKKVAAVSVFPYSFVHTDRKFDFAGGHKNEKIILCQAPDSAGYPAISSFSDRRAISGPLTDSCLLANYPISLWKSASFVVSLLSTDFDEACDKVTVPYQIRAF
jgi:hypothetical protein